MTEALESAEFFPGSADAPALVLDAPLSFWGGVDPQSGKIIAVRHPQLGESVTGRVMIIPAPIGSSTSSAVLLELIHRGYAPAGIILGEPDAILVVGCLIAREMGWPAPPVLIDGSIKKNLPVTGARMIVANGCWRVAV